MRRILRNPEKFSKRILKERDPAVLEVADLANLIIQSSLKKLKLKTDVTCFVNDY